MNNINNITGSLFLKMTGRNKLAVVKLLKDALGLDLISAKKLAESAPCYICKDIDINVVNDLAQQLLTLGAMVRVESNDAIHSNGPASTATGSLFLKMTGRNKVLVVKLLKETLGLDFISAKQLVESAPCYVCKDFDIDVVNALAQQLLNLGAIVSVEVNDDNNTCPPPPDKQMVQEEDIQEDNGIDINRIFEGTLFYCVLDEKQFGPVTARQFANMARYGVVDANTLVWSNGMSQWAIAQSVVELQNLV